MSYAPTMQPGNVYLAGDPTTAVPVLHIAIVGDGKIHVTTADDTGAQTITSLDPADIHHIDFEMG